MRGPAGSDAAKLGLGQHKNQMTAGPPQVHVLGPPLKYQFQTLLLHFSNLYNKEIKKPDSERNPVENQPDIRNLILELDTLQQLEIIKLYGQREEWV